MKRIFPKKTLYYRSETDDFVTLSENSQIRIDKFYKYRRDSLIQRLGDFIAYRLIATPLAFIYTKHKLRENYIGKKKLKELSARTKPDSGADVPKGYSAKKSNAKHGFFIYSNHTQQIADAFTPNMLTFPKKNSVIIDKNNLSMPVLGRHLKRLGALPLPEDMKASKNFTDEVTRRINNGEAVTVYPEAHVWEYFTGIRNFSDSLMELPVRCSAPVFSATRVYKQNRRGKVVCDIYIDGPFYPDASISKRDAMAKLKDEVYTAMCKRAALNETEVIKYIKSIEEN